MVYQAEIHAVGNQKCVMGMYRHPSFSSYCKSHPGSITVTVKGSCLATDNSSKNIPQLWPVLPHHHYLVNNASTWSWIFSGVKPWWHKSSVLPLEDLSQEPWDFLKMQVFSLQMASRHRVTGKLAVLGSTFQFKLLNAWIYETLPPPTHLSSLHSATVHMLSVL